MQPAKQPNSPALIVAYYQDYLLTQDTATFNTLVLRRYQVPTLERLARMGQTPARRAAVLALGYLADYESNAVLGKALLDADRSVRMLAENSIRCVWKRSGTEQQQIQLERILDLNATGQYEESVPLATDLIEQAPWFAEAWNQRSVAWFRLERFRDCVRDAHQTLEINAFHFCAATGMGQAYLRLGELLLSLESFRRSLAINPNQEVVRAQITRLERHVERGG